MASRAAAYTSRIEHWLALRKTAAEANAEALSAKRELEMDLRRDNVPRDALLSASPRVSWKEITFRGDVTLALLVKELGPARGTRIWEARSTQSHLGLSTA